MDKLEYCGLIKFFNLLLIDIHPQLVKVSYFKCQDVVEHHLKKDLRESRFVDDLLFKIQWIAKVLGISEEKVMVLFP